MLQKFPTLVVITISNEGAKPGVCPMLGFLSLVLLQVHIGQAAPHTVITTQKEGELPSILSFQVAAHQQVCKEINLEAFKGYKAMAECDELDLGRKPQDVR